MKGVGSQRGWPWIAGKVAGSRGSGYLIHEGETSQQPFLPESGLRKFFANPLRRTVSLWVLLIGMFFTTWKILEPSPGDAVAPTQAPRADTVTNIWTTLLPLAFSAVVVLLVLPWARGFNKMNAAGVRAMTEGDFAEAGKTFERVLARYRWPATFRVAHHNLGVTRLHQGRLAEALDSLAAADRCSSNGAPLKPLIAGNLAFANALSGSLDTARTWRAEAETRFKAAPAAPSAAAFIDSATAVIDVREGRADEFVRWFDERRPRLEGALTARMMRALDVVRAYALAQREDATDDSQSRRALEALKPTRDGELAMLESGWPEMRAFLGARGDAPKQ